MKYFLIILVPALVAVPVLILMEPYRLLRLSAFIDPWASPKNEGYQLIQSLYALGNGGWFGTGLFRSRQKYRFLPFAEMRLYSVHHRRGIRVCGDMYPFSFERDTHL